MRMKNKDLILVVGNWGYDSELVKELILETMRLDAKKVIEGGGLMSGPGLINGWGINKEVVKAKDVQKISTSLAQSIIQRLEKLTEEGKVEWESLQENVWGVFLKDFGGIQIVFDPSGSILFLRILKHEGGRVEMIGQSENLGMTSNLYSCLTTLYAFSQRLLYLFSISNEVEVVYDGEGV